ncbi:fucose isomerase [Enterocloster clostridioformis]|uniref:L-fucose/L-arabinose isomerase family protein n=1 Tax=Enterocloster clostridioformis TaxID=1531 RepID=UPI00080C9781|nr:L-fucose/L-arabinose isomerase family protein [Enterocloster clostridioformis]ANU45162.1 fucose isomerase [Lachnoclostridium sp. YL32]NDO27459.1 fucose isomerase [Enterocloster clostridioformis]OXE69925.1 fucose isomerase [Enterocloster clostridioformis]QQR00073.1 L-fucose/L-arabinose isomerase family protein [Enterocloster clostridioformis]
MDKIKIGFAPTRRSIFSAPDAVKYRKLTAERLKELKIDFVDITDINEEGLLYCDEDRMKIAEKFKQERVDGLFLPHCNFGTEYECARLAKELNVPVLLWGPLDERPEADGTRLRDTQCGLFATGKVLRRFRIPFTYMTNCRLSDPVFERGVRDFLAVCNVVKRFRNMRILQISTRPFDFWTTMCNEGELLEKFNIQLAPVPMPELTDAIRKAKEEGTQVEETIKYCREKMEILVDDTALENVAALKVAMKRLIDQYGCQAAAIQCWNQLQSEIGIMPCAANSLLNEEGIPVVCETDIHGAITSLLVEAAGMGETRTFFADWTIRHPDVENGELLQHCGPWPLSVAREKAKLTYPLAFDHPGSITAEAKHGEITLARFDGDNGEYSMLLGNAKGIDGPKGMGTYLWVEVDNIKRLEAKLVEGPYIHHCVGIHKNVVAVLYEACKYMGIKPDLYDPVEEEVKAYLRGE